MSNKLCENHNLSMGYMMINNGALPGSVVGSITTVSFTSGQLSIFS